MTTYRDKIKELGKKKYIPFSENNAEIVVFNERGLLVEKIKNDIIDDYTEYKGKKYYVYHEAEDIHGETKNGFYIWL